MILANCINGQKLKRPWIFLYRLSKRAKIFNENFWYAHALQGKRPGLPHLKLRRWVLMIFSIIYAFLQIRTILETCMDTHFPHVGVAAPYIIIVPINIWPPPPPASQMTPFLIKRNDKKLSQANNFIFFHLQFYRHNY